MHLNTRVLFLWLLLSLPILNYAQNCNCESNFLWVKKTFEENDAGFQYTISKKGKDAYELHNKMYLEKVKHLSNNQECATLLNQWIRFFRNGHIGVNYIGKTKKAEKVTEQNKQPIEKDLNPLNATKPLFEKINENTVYLRIPDFEISEKKAIDSLILANRATILSTENFIIDVRNNPGGSDASYSSLIPFLYTQPIRTVGALFYSTDLNNQRMLELSQNPDFDEESKKTFKNYYEKLQANKGEYVDLFNKKVNITKMDTIQPYPKNIGIVINENNGSTTEQFLLTAMQSKKVKLYGRTTKGMLDISNVNIVTSPCGDIELYYGLSKSYRIPDFPVDDIGLQPDVYIDKTIDPSNWLDFVRDHLNGK
ncbi:S41 family peptidase [Sphingobacterium siyangense]|uniref:S41 family peptidase n=1 Tax=Sphingobacterium siyangense TaxID=459529 RepID=UPI000E749FF7|nr:S41 family peptidase [Sphingobacterium siyangense]